MANYGTAGSIASFSTTSHILKHQQNIFVLNRAGIHCFLTVGLIFKKKKKQREENDELFVR